MSNVILLTGASGFVGRQVLKALVDTGVELKLVVRDIKQWERDGYGDNVTLVATADLFAEDTHWWQKACANVDLVIHCAWYAEPGEYLDSPKNLDCLSGTLTLAKACVEAGVRRFVGVGTCFEYDVSAGYLSIETPLKPANPYAAAKAAAFLSLEKFFANAGVAFAWCRLFYLYGEGEDSRRLVAHVRSQLEAGLPALLSSGEQVRDFLDVETAGRMIARVACGEAQGPVNICSSVPVTVRELVERIADEYGRRDLLKFGAREANPLDPPCVVGVKVQGNEA